MDLLALAIAQEFRGIDTDRAMGILDVLGEELLRSVAESGDAPEEVVSACSRLLGTRSGFRGPAKRWAGPRSAG
jgi:hypothetical protein